MLSFFRRALSSWLVLGLLALLMIAFIVTGVGTPNNMGLDALSGGGGNRIAKVGGRALGADEVTQRIQQEVNSGRQQNPTLDVPSFVASGGYEGIVDALITSLALDEWARRHGFAVSKRQVDGEIASIPAFQGPTGKFDRATFDRLLAQQRITERQLRDDVTRDLITRQLLGPAGGAARVGTEIARPYASLLLERRQGSIGVVPISAMGQGAAPSAAEINSFYARNIASYTLPERRVIRYALIGLDKVPAVKPNEAEIAAFYKTNAANYAPSESRSFSQIVLPDEKAAHDFVTKVRGGTPFVAAAKAAGFAEKDVKLGKQSRQQLSELATPAAADAAFRAADGAVLDPQRSPLGWHVIRVDGIEKVGGRSLAEAHDEIATNLARQKQSEGLADLVQKVEDEIADGATFEEVAKKHGLGAVTTPPVTAVGASPDTPNWKLAPELKLLLKAAFDAAPEDDASVETIGGGGSYALLDVDRVIAPSPIPLAQARPVVVQALAVTKANERARAVAQAIAAKANAGTPIEKAVAEAGVKLPAPQPVSGRQADFAGAGRQMPAPIQMLFSMTAGSTRLLPAPGGQGWFVVHLDKIEHNDAGKVPPLVESVRGQLSQLAGNEYAEQFANAVATDVGVKRDEAAIARLKRELASGAAAQ